MGPLSPLFISGEGGAIIGSPFHIAFSWTPGGGFAAGYELRRPLTPPTSVGSYSIVVCGQSPSRGRPGMNFPGTPPGAPPTRPSSFMAVALSGPGGVGGACI